MRLIVETGEGLPEANSYIDITDIENYLPSSVYNNFKTLTADEQVDRMIIASFFIDYSFNWLGKIKTIEQGLSFPRTDIIFQGHELPNNIIPKQVKKASAMAVNLIMVSGINVFQKTGKAQIKKEKMAIFETEYFEVLKKEYLNSSEYSDINNVLRGLFFKSSGGVVSVEVNRK